MLTCVFLAYSVKSIVHTAGVNFDLNAMIPTVRGDMNLLDCALECEVCVWRLARNFDYFNVCCSGGVGYSGDECC